MPSNLFSRKGVALFIIAWILAINPCFSEEKVLAVVLSVSGSACKQAITECVALTNGQKIYSFDRLSIGSGNIVIYSFLKKKRLLLGTGKHTFDDDQPLSKSDLVKYATMRLHALSDVSDRSTAAMPTRSATREICKDSYSETGCIKVLQSELSALDLINAGKYDLCVARQALFYHYGFLDKAIEELQVCLGQSH